MNLEMRAGFDVSDEAVAELLADTLADSAFWKALDHGAEDEGMREMIAAKAVTIYRTTSPVIERATNEGEILPVLYAVAALREIADCAVILSQPWPSASTRDQVLGGPPGIVRPVIDFMIRADGIDEWAHAFGLTLQVSETEIPDAAWPKRGDSTDFTQQVAEMVEHVGSVLKAYGQALYVLDDDISREGLNDTRLQMATAVWISASRWWTRWTRAALPEAEPAAATTLHASQALFLLSHGVAPASTLFPSADHVRLMLEQSDIDSWWPEEGPELPDWLRNPS